jgi:hypothetical protein
MRWALIVDGAVQEITSLDPAGRFHEELVWVSCPPAVRERWVYDGSNFSAPPAPAELPAQVSVDVFFERTTEDEAEQIEAAMLSKSTKIKRAYQAATVFVEGTDLWDALWSELTSLFTAKRRDELLSA